MCQVYNVPETGQVSSEHNCPPFFSPHHGEFHLDIYLLGLIFARADSEAPLELHLPRPSSWSAEP